MLFSKQFFTKSATEENTRPSFIACIEAQLEVASSAAQVMGGQTPLPKATSPSSPLPVQACPEGGRRAPRIGQL